MGLKFKLAAVQDKLLGYYSLICRVHGTVLSASVRTQKPLHNPFYKVFMYFRSHKIDR